MSTSNRSNFAGGSGLKNVRTFGDYHIVSDLSSSSNPRSVGYSTLSLLMDGWKVSCEVPDSGPWEKSALPADGCSDRLTRALVTSAPCFILWSSGSCYLSVSIIEFICASSRRTVSCASGLSWLVISLVKHHIDMNAGNEYQRSVTLVDFLNPIAFVDFRVRASLMKARASWAMWFLARTFGLLSSE